MYYLIRALKKLKPISKKRVNIHKTSKIEGGTQIVNSSMDKYSFCGYDCVIINTRIGSFCSLANNIKIGLVSHPLNWVSTSCAFYYGRDSIKKDLANLEYTNIDPITVIGNDVWIAENVIIKAGVKISDGAVIGMGSVLTNDVGPYEIWAGNPARLIRKRFDEDTINKLLKSKWWDLEDEKIQTVSKFMNEPLRFLDKLR